MGNPALRTRIVLAFAAVYLIWGSTYLAIRFGVAEVRFAQSWHVAGTGP